MPVEQAKLPCMGCGLMTNRSTLIVCPDCSYSVCEDCICHGCTINQSGEHLTRLTPGCTGVGPCRGGPLQGWALAHFQASSSSKTSRIDLKDEKQDLSREALLTSALNSLSLNSPKDDWACGRPAAVRMRYVARMSSVGEDKGKPSEAQSTKPQEVSDGIKYYQGLVTSDIREDNGSSSNEMLGRNLKLAGGVAGVLVFLVVAFLAIVLGSPAWAQNAPEPSPAAFAAAPITSDPSVEVVAAAAPASPRPPVNSLQALATQATTAANALALPRNARATGASGGGANPSGSSSSLRHKSTTHIPSWSRALSSQQLAIECQKVNHQVRSSNAVVGTRECVAVLEMEVMKFVAYCGGVTLEFRVDECPPSSPQSPFSSHPPSIPHWGLASTRPCPALQQQPTDLQPIEGGSSQSSSHGPASAPGSSLPGSPSPPLILQVDSASRKPLHVVCSPPQVSSALAQPLSQGDIFTIDLVPREDRQPSIIATLSRNGVVVHQRSLPCDKINSLQLYPFFILPPGALASLHKAVTPSPLFTFYTPHLPATNGGGILPVQECQLAELDTCVRYTTLPPSADPPVPPLAPGVATGPPGDVLGSVSFTSGRHRWTMQLDNYSSSSPTHIFVGVLGTVASQQISAALVPSFCSEVASSSLGSLQGSGSSSPSDHKGSPGGGTSLGLIPQLEAGRSSSPPSSLAALDADDDANQPDAAASKWPPKWGIWVRLPVASTGVTLEQPCPSPPADPSGSWSHLTVSSSAHCFITVDLDLDAGLVRFFRNGHLISSAFQGLKGPITPLLSFIQAPQVSCQAGQFNLTKVNQVDLGWNPDKCSGDLRLNGPLVSKVAEVYGDYSTVLASQGFISGVHLWMVKIGHLSEPDSIFIGVCRGCMPLDQDPQDLRDRTYYLSNGVIRVAGRRVATNAANFTKGDVIGVVLDADQGEVVFFRNGIEQGRAKGIRGRLYPFVSCDSEADQVVLMGSYALQMNRLPRQAADMEWDTLGHAADLELSPNCLTATKTTLSLPLSQSLDSGGAPSTVRGSILYNGPGIHQFHVILDSVGPDGVWVGAVPPASTTSEAEASSGRIVGDCGFGWALHSDGDKRFDGREEEFASAFKNGDVLTVTMDPKLKTISFSRNGQLLGEAFNSVTFPLVAAVTLASEESRVTIQNRQTVINTGYTGELRWDEARSGKDLQVVDGLTVTKVANEGGDYATVLGTLSLASGQHVWNIYINHVEDSNIFIGCSVGGHDLNADPQEMKHRTYYLSNGTIRVAGKLVTRCAEPYAEGDVVSVQLDMEQHHVTFLKNGTLQGAGDGLPEEVWPYVSLDNVMDSLTLHSSKMFIDLAQSLRWNQAIVGKQACLSHEGERASLRGPSSGHHSHHQSSTHEATGQATVLGLREYKRQEAHSWIVRFGQPPPSAQGAPPARSNFLVGVAPPGMDLNRSLGEEGCGVAVDYYGYFYVNGRYFHSSNLSNWSCEAKVVKGSTAKHKGKSLPAFSFNEEGVCDVTVILDLKEGTLRFIHNGRNIGTIASIKGPLHAAVTLTSSRQSATLLPGPMGHNEQTSEELVNVLKAKGLKLSPRLEAALLVVPRDLFLPRDRQREAFKDNRIALRMQDASILTVPPPSFVAKALEQLALQPGESFLDVGCGSGYVTALAACLIMPSPVIKGPAASTSPTTEGKKGICFGLDCIGSRLEHARGNLKTLRDKIALLSSSNGPSTSQGPSAAPALIGGSILPSTLALASTVLCGDPLKALQAVELTLANVLVPECTAGVTFDALYCDASASEEDLPMLLSLLKPGGRMVLVIDDEAVLVTKGQGSQGSDGGPRLISTSISPSINPHHDFTREPIEGLLLRASDGQMASGCRDDFGVLDDPTPWQVQDAIRDIKERERKQGQEQTKAEVSNQRSYEYLEMQQRVQGAMQRIVELERILEAQARAGGPPSSAMASPLRTSLPTNPMSGASGGLPTQSQPAVSFSPWASPVRSTPINSPRMTPGSGAVTPGDDVKAVARDTSSAHGHYYRVQHSLSPRQGSVRTRGGPLFRGNGPSQLLRDGVPGSPDKDPLGIEFVEPSTPGSMVNFATSGLFSGEVSMPQQAFDDIIDSLSVQTFTEDQIQAMIAAAEVGGAAEPIEVESREVFPGIFKGVKVRVWKTTISQQLGYLELKTAYSRYCIAHPHICAVLGVCIQEDSSTNGTDLEDSVFEESEDDVKDNEPTAEGLYSSTSRSSLRTVRHNLFVVEESFGDESLFSRLERGLLSWQQVVNIATDICKSLAFLQDMRLASSGSEDPSPQFGDVAVLSEYALRTFVSPSNVHVDPRSNKVSVLPALLNHLETSLGGGDFTPSSATASMMSAMNSNMAYMDPNSLFSNDKSSSSSRYFAFGVVLLQLLCEQGPLGLIRAVREAILADTTSLASSPSSLLALIPRLPASSEVQSWATDYCLLALRLTEAGGVSNLESEVLPKLESLSIRLSSLSGVNKAMSWEQVEEVLMLPLQPKATSSGASGAGTGARRWVRSDFRQRRKLFLEEVAKLAVEGPVHKMEIRRARCFKDSVHVFAGKGHAVWKQPLKITFTGEAGIDNGGVTREWFSALSTAIARNSPDLFWNVGSQKNQMYISPLSNSPSHLKKFHFVGLFMAKAILESAARSRELGTIVLAGLDLCEPFWKLLLGIPLNLMDLQLLDPTEFRSLMSLLDMDIDGIIFENFVWTFHHSNLPTPGAHTTGANAAASLPAWEVEPSTPPSHLQGHLQSSSAVNTPTSAVPGGGGGGGNVFALTSAASPFGADDGFTSIPLKPGGSHIRVTNPNKREYVLLKAHKMLVGTIENQMSAIIDAFHSLIPRDLLDKYNFTSMEMQLLVCGEQRVDVLDLKRSCRYEDGYNGSEDVIAWFWEAAEGLDEAHRRQLLQFWSGSDGMPAEGFSSLDPPFHMVAVDRIYDSNDTTARLPAAHTCFRQLDLPRYKSLEETREKLITAITIGQGYMGIS